MCSELNTGDEGNSERRDWLCALLLQRGSTLGPRFVSFYRQLSRRPRPWRRQLQRKLAVTVTGAALLLALAGPIFPTQAAPDAAIQVVNGEVEFNDNGKCSLMEAIWNARSANAGNMKADCTAGNSAGPDTVSLPNNGVFVLTAAHNNVYGPTGLPVITSDVTIEGHGSTIRRDTSPGTPDFRILAVDSSGSLTLRDTTLRGGHYNGYLDGLGVYNKGTLTIERSTITDGFSQGQGGGVFNDGTLTLTDSNLTGNRTENGGGGLTNLGEATIDGSLIAHNNVTYYGGGLENGYGATLVMTNSTVSANYSWENGAGGILNYGAMTLNNVTVTQNGVGYDGSGGIRNTSGAELTLNQSVIAGNYRIGYYGGVYQDEIGSSGTITANAHNVFGHDGNDGSFGLTLGATDVVPDGPLGSVLGPLTDNGGPTWTHSLPAGSPAIDLAPNGQCAAAPVGGVDQRGLPRNADGDGAASAAECDAGATERQFGPDEHTLFLSTSGKGNVGGVSFTPGDILRYEPGMGWSLAFDASDVGVTKNVSAIELLDGGSWQMAFAANQKLDGKTAKPQDSVLFFSDAAGEETAGRFIIFPRGTDVGLTTAGEKIDALGDAGDGRTILSTSGAASVKRPDNSTLKAADEDLLALNPATGEWSAFFDGSTIPGLKAEDVNALWIDPATGDLYISIVGSFKLGAVQGNGRDIVKLTVDAGAPGGYSPSLWWDGSAEGFPTNIDGLEILP